MRHCCCAVNILKQHPYRGRGRSNSTNEDNLALWPHKKAPHPLCWLDARNRNSGEKWVAEKAEPTSPAESLGEPTMYMYVRMDQKRGTLLGGQQVRWYDGTILEISGPMTKGGQHRMDQKRGALLGGKYMQVRWYDGTIQERSGPITKGGHSTYCGTKCSLGCTQLPRLCEPTASLRRGGGEHNLPTVKKSKADLHSTGRFAIHSEVQVAWFTRLIPI